MNKLYSLIASLILSGNMLLAQSTGFMSPTATANPNGFTNANLAFASDDQWASVIHQSGCRCPFIYLSWNGGVNYTSSQLLGPFGTTDVTQTAGSPTFTWGHSWTDSEFSNTNFRLKIANPSTLIEQGYADFNFNVPQFATITGIEVRLEWHGDANFTMEFLDHAQVNVHYTISTATINLADGSDDINLFPNPATDFLNINLTGIGEWSYSIMSADGKLVSEEKTKSSAPNAQIPLTDLTAGVYFITFITDKGVVTKKIVRQ